MIIYGKNAQANWDLYHQSQPDWWWFHSEPHSSAWVVVTEKKLTEEHYNQVAKIIKKKGPIMYTKIKNVTLGEDIGSSYVDKFRTFHPG